jgi:acetate kinase
LDSRYYNLVAETAPHRRKSKEPLDGRPDTQLRRLVHQPLFQRDHDCPNHRDAIELIVTTLLDPEVGAISDLSDIKAVGHRVAHGGDRFATSVITGIEAAREVLPGVPQCAIMDTAWHRAQRCASS